LGENRRGLPAMNCEGVAMTSATDDFGNS
jgi:hypothetical protein